MRYDPRKNTKKTRKAMQTIQRGAKIFIVLLCVLVFCASSVRSQTHTHERRLILVLCEGLTADDILSNRFPHLRDLSERSAVALMNCAVTGKRDTTATLLTLATGQRIASEPEDALAASHSERNLTPEQGDVLTIYQRRTGNLSLKMQSDSIVHLNIASLLRRNIVPQNLGSVLSGASPPVSSAIFGNLPPHSAQRTAAILTLDGIGRTTGRFDIFRPEPNDPKIRKDDPLRLAQIAAESSAAFTVVVLNEAVSLDLFLYLLQASQHDADAMPALLIVSPRPPDTQNRLTPVIAFGRAFPPGLLTSATTRTPGLIANTDIAPTILKTFDIAASPTMIGKPAIVLKSANAAERLAAISRLDYVSQLNDQALHRVMPIFAGVFALYFALLFLRSQPPRWLVLGLVPILFLPAALLLAPILVPPTLSEYALRIVAWQFALTIFALLLARLTRSKLPVLIAAVNVVLILGDILTGQTLLKDSLLSGYALSGIRYYGIGNEYLGVLLAFVLTGTFLALDNRVSSLPSPGVNAASCSLSPVPCSLILLFWIGVLFIVGWVGLGANAGSLVAGVAGFGVGTAILYGRRPTWKLTLVCILFGLLLAFAFGSIEEFFLTQKNGGGSHFGTALRTAANQNDVGYLLEIAARKAAMNLRLFLLPAFLATLAALAFVGFLGHRRFRSVLTAAFPSESWIRRALPAFLATAVAALIFKDSGVITAAFFLALSAFLLLLAALSKQRVEDKK